MRTYRILPKKYENIRRGEIKVIDGYAYAVYRAAYSGECDTVHRMSELEYNLIKNDAAGWQIVKCEQTEENIQLQIWEYMVDCLDVYCKTTPY